MFGNQTMSNDYTSTLALNLQQRVSSLENAVGFLMGEVQRLSQGSSQPSQGFQTSIPLQPIQGRRPYVPRPLQAPQVSHASHASHTSHASQSHASPSIRPSHVSEDAPTPIALSEILTNGEVVTFGIHTGRDASGSVTTSFLTATVDGTNLTVKECGAVSSLIGLSSSKPGEILFKFMHGLVDAHLLPRTFNALPWRLATVSRDGQKVTLAQLRRDKQDSQ